MDYQTYLNNKKEEQQQAEKLGEEMKAYANRLFSSEEGRKYAKQMLKKVNYFDDMPPYLSADDLRYRQAQRDFVNIFLVGLITKENLIKIIEEM